MGKNKKINEILYEIDEYLKKKCIYYNKYEITNFI